MISNRWKILAAALPIIGTLAIAQPQPGGLGGFFQAVWGAYNKFVVTYLTEDLAQDNDFTVFNVVETNYVSYPPFATSSADIRTFSGSESYLYATPPSQIVTNQPWTGEAWVNHDNFTPRSPSDNLPRTTIFSLYGPSTFRYQWIGHYDGSLRVGLRNSSVNLLISTGTALSTGVWYHVAWAESQSYRKVYVDGSLVFSNNTSFDFRDIPTTFYIGTAQPALLELRGKVSEARLWNYERSDQEILDNYNKRMRGDEPGLVGYWPLNEGNL